MSSSGSSGGAAAPSSSYRRLPGAGRVLVVEDEPAIRETLEILIGIEGCETEMAADVDQALEILSRWTPDLILLDLTLPGRSGADFVSEYRQMSVPQAPIILMTGMPLRQSDVAALGAVGMLEKPFDVDDLLEIVATFAECTDDS